MGDPRFAAEVSVRRGEQVATVTGQLVNAGADAVQVLRDSLRSDSEAVRLRAAHLILTVGTQLRHARELEERLGRVGGAPADRRQVPVTSREGRHSGRGPAAAAGGRL
jgi:hypothetical protein